LEFLYEYRGLFISRKRHLGRIGGIRATF